MKKIVIFALLVSLTGCVTQKTSMVCIPETASVVSTNAMEFEFKEDADFYLCQPSNIHGSY